MNTEEIQYGKKDFQSFQLRPKSNHIGCSCSLELSTDEQQYDNNDNMSVQMLVQSDEILHDHHFKVKFSQSSAASISLTINLIDHIRDKCHSVEHIRFRMKGQYCPEKSARL